MTNGSTIELHAKETKAKGYCCEVGGKCRGSLRGQDSLFDQAHGNDIVDKGDKAWEVAPLEQPEERGVAHQRLCQSPDVFLSLIVMEGQDLISHGLEASDMKIEVRQDCIGALLDRPVGREQEIYYARLGEGLHRFEAGDTVSQ